MRLIIFDEVDVRIFDNFGGCQLCQPNWDFIVISSVIIELETEKYDDLGRI